MSNTIEATINKRTEEYLLAFKQEVKNKATCLDFMSADRGKLASLLEYIYEYPRLVFTEDELHKPKRSKQVNIAMGCRCIAIRTTGDQCTRKRRLNSSYCGTHHKTHKEPEVNMEIEENIAVPDTFTIEVFTEDVQGIVYYIDLAGNVYNTEDVLMKKKDPRIVARAVRGIGPGNISFIWP